MDRLYKFTLTLAVLTLLLPATVAAAFVEYVGAFRSDAGRDYVVHMTFSDQIGFYGRPDGPPASSSITDQLFAGYSGGSYWVESSGETLYTGSGVALDFWFGQEPYGERTLNSTELYPYFPSEFGMPSGAIAVSLDENGDVLDWETWESNSFGLPPELVYIGNGSVSIEDGIHLRPSPVPLPATAWLFGFGILGLVNLVRRNKNRAAL
ncbi:MAG: hypothetical protein ABW170_15650 [Candidatus Thiodiazotropha sp. L084R]